MIRDAILVITLAATAGAQTPADTGTGFAQRMKQNDEALRQYSFKRRTEFQIKNHTRTREELVRFVDGKRETVPLDGAQPERDQEQGRNGMPGRGGLLRGAIMKQKKQEMKQDVGQLQSLMRSYVSQESLRNALRKANISKTGEGPDARLVLSAKGVVQPADAVILTWNIPARRPENIQITSELDGKPATATAEYAELPNGLFYAAHTHVSVPRKQIEITIDTFDYTPGTDAR